jgi:hypothetical protein
MLRIDKRRELWQSIASRPAAASPRRHHARRLDPRRRPRLLRTIVARCVTGRTRVVVKDGF